MATPARRMALLSQSFSTTRSQQLDFVRKPTAKVAPPTEQIPDVETFLTKIGRKAVEVADTFETWQSLMTMSSADMKQKGIDTRLRRYAQDYYHEFFHPIYKC